MKPIKILVNIPNPGDGTALYRFNEPFIHLSKEEDLDIQFAVFTSVDRNWWGFYDIAFFQRPASEHEVEMIKYCVKIGLPVWVDYDDLLIDIPTSNIVYHAYVNSNLYVRDCVNLATVVTVTTEHLKDKLIERYPSAINKIQVVPNHWNDYKIVNKPELRKEKSFLYRGSITHLADIYIYKDYLPVFYINKLDDRRRAETIKYNYFGINPFFLEMPYDYILPVPLDDYFEAYNKIESMFGLILLEPIDFNLSKSNISLLEAVSHGRIPISPNFLDGINCMGPTTSSIYKHREHLSSTIITLLNTSIEELEKLYDEYWKFIQSYKLSLINLKRLAIIKTIVKRNKQNKKRLEEEEE